MLKLRSLKDQVEEGTQLLANENSPAQGPTVRIMNLPRAGRPLSTLLPCADASSTDRILDMIITEMLGFAKNSEVRPLGE